MRIHLDTSRSSEWNTISEIVNINLTARTIFKHIPIVAETQRTHAYLSPVDRLIILFISIIIPSRTLVVIN